jgi:anthranilate/para-aminobenzoate synthase component I
MVHVPPPPLRKPSTLQRLPQYIKVVGSSPERFLSWTREGTCQFRPIKGTVKKSPTTTRAMAEEALKTPKEQAENLMIVDLIRHDLSGVHGYVSFVDFLR